MTLDILINGQRVDILDRSSINLRLNNVLYNPTEINSRQAEYSFSFNLPTTPNNNKIFGYANVLAKNNKFGTDYNCEVYSDEILIFTGTLRVQTIQRGFYNVNLVNIKINTVETIFGEMKMNEIDWKIPFTGPSSINMHNADYNSKVIFPLVSYGVFQKAPSSNFRYEWNQYYGKFQIDEYNKWYYESFVPSPNLLELVKKAFNQKGYEVHGNIFQDKVLNNLYMSENLADQQIPTYNLGQPNLGRAEIFVTFNNTIDRNTGNNNKASYYQHNLSYPYLPVAKQGEWNWSSVNIYDLWSNENSAVSNFQDEHYMFYDNCIVIPADGLYKIKLSVNGEISSQTLEASEYWNPTRGQEAELHTITLNNDLKDDMPIEVQLVRNSNECELIHGSKQWGYTNGDRTLRYEWNTVYPHENLYMATNPTVTNGQYSSTTSDRVTSQGSSRTNRRTSTPGAPAYRPSTPGRPSTNSFQGYMPKVGELLAYDPWVNGNFIAGITSVGGGFPSIIKNGYSWNPSCSDKNNSRYVCDGYYKLENNTFTETIYNQNILSRSPINSYSGSNNSFYGVVSGVVWLNRNDVISLKALARSWQKDDVDVNYAFSVDSTVTIEAYSPMDLAAPDWNQTSLFDQDLQIGNFLNKETKVSDFIQNFIKEFNLEYVNEGNVVYLNKQAFNIDEAKYCINIDNRVNEGESSVVEYPGTMQVKYKIDTEEWGFETTVPPDKLNDPNWKDYGDYGSNKINISNNDTEENVQLTTSYTYYDTFRIVDHDGTQQGEFTIPVISKYSYMIDGYSYEESMKVDGKGLPLRYWFRGDDTGYQVNVNDRFPVSIYDTKNSYNGVELSYYNKKGTLLSQYFNIQPNLSSNYISVKCYIGATEYKLLKGGANVLFDSDIYIVSEIQGYDPSGINPTELILLKK